jgi:hypothetical protein
MGTPSSVYEHVSTSKLGAWSRSRAAARAKRSALMHKLATNTWEAPVRFACDRVKADSQRLIAIFIHMTASFKIHKSADRQITPAGLYQHRLPMPHLKEGGFKKLRRLRLAIYRSTSLGQHQFAAGALH